MGVNKVEYGGDILIDLTGDTITESDVPTGKTFHSADGEQKIGSVTEYTEDKTFGASKLYRSNLVIMSNTTPIVVMEYLFDSDVFVRNGIKINLFSRLDNFGDATAEDVVKGKTFTSAAGLKEVGTHVCSGGSIPKLIEKTITENGTYNAADEGADGYSAVTVDIDSTGGSSDNNCEAYHITRTSDTISFKGSGTIKVWGYGYYSQSTYSKTTYAFVGDGYYTSSYYGTPSKTSKTWSLNSDGTLSGLPTLTSCDLLVEIGV